MSLSSLFSLAGKLLALRVWQWVIIGVVLFGIYCFWCLWLGSRAEAEFKKVDAEAKADASKFKVWLGGTEVEFKKVDAEAKVDASKFKVWFRSILVRLHFAKAK